MIYLASPYSHPDPAVRQERYEQTKAAQAYLLRQGQHVYSPIVACHPMALAHDLPTDAKWWESYNDTLLAACGWLYVLELDGWHISSGVRDEIEKASLWHKGIRHCTWTGNAVVVHD